MHTSFSVLTLLLPLAVFSSPLPEAGAPSLIPGEDAVSMPRSSNELFERSTQSCKTVGVSGTYARCRTGPSTSYTAKWALYEGTTYAYSCYEDGECIEGNW